MESGESRTHPNIPPRQRILDASFELFARRGIRDVGVDELIAKSKVAKATFYKHFHTKDDLVRAYLERWYEERNETIDKAAAARRSSGSPEQAILAIFDVFDDWFQRGAAEVSTFLHVMIEMGPDHPLGKASIEYLARTRRQLACLAVDAGIRDPESFAWSLHILLKGSIVASAEGDHHAAARARQMAALLIDLHRAPVSQGSVSPAQSIREQAILEGQEQSDSVSVASRYDVPDEESVS
ncbi:TetR/AcrR family transcriptional regulator [Pseudarthrobacter sp. J75]|uniref:TetR/AcrR family transcriptional regulator n=1 Tax=unclassified Pseudarthrobacter TaxID=2647000 RepID=UPI002E82279E|nr:MULTISPECIES: TetR/AcrR family transcriptional regulator [unclassified Pseudarthrobacter]MEE2523138.1 TetR/AcrR family transcriptional regulator [Pseudarthrobacter sp. J47]MEE2529822.1 TetR/AcrR family transcriptional regulator [Pseudarthrobacter sp. J75]